MAPTPSWLSEKVRAYYRETTVASYLRSWSREALAFHLGMHEGEDCTHEQSLMNTNRFLADRAGVKPGMRVLDAGCGIGGSGIYLARERGALVDGISLDPGGIALAHRFAAERGAGARTTFQVMDFMATSFPDATFDVVWSIESVCYAHDAAAFFTEVARVLKPGGRFACLDVFRGDTGPPEHHRALAAGCALADLRSRPETAAAARRAGLADVTDEDVTPRVLRSAEVLWDKAQMSQILLEMERRLHVPARPVYRGHIRGGLGAAAGLFSGAVTYGHLAATRPADR